MTGVYLLHFVPRFKHAGHYLGWADDIGERLKEHRAGRGARLTKAASKAGCLLRLVRVWDGENREFERSLKGRGKTGKAHTGTLARLCPECKKEKACELRTGAREDGRGTGAGRPRATTRPSKPSQTPSTKGSGTSGAAS